MGISFDYMFTTDEVGELVGSIDKAKRKTCSLCKKFAEYMFEFQARDLTSPFAASITRPPAIPLCSEHLDSKKERLINFDGAHIMWFYETAIQYNDIATDIPMIHTWGYDSCEELIWE